MTRTRRAAGWRDCRRGERAFVDGELARLGFADRRQPWWGLIRMAFASPARLAMIQAQDVLGLGSEARMNVPARVGGNWRWQMEPGALTPALARQLREETEATNRLPG